MMMMMMMMMMMIVVKVLITEPHHSNPGVQAARAFNLAINIPLPSAASQLSLHTCIVFSNATKKQRPIMGHQIMHERECGL